MAMKTASPWWFSAIFAAGLFSLFLGQRAFDGVDGVNTVLSWLGALLVLGVTGLRAWTFMGTTGERRVVERTLLFCQLGVLVSLALYLTTTEWGHGLLGIDTTDAESFDRFQIPMIVVWSIGLAISLIPMLMIELSLGTARRNRFIPSELDGSEGDQQAVESFRVREMASSGLTVALAAAFLMVTCNVADQRNIRRDVSYFKTSSPGSATVNVTKDFPRKVKVVLFFPEVNETKSEVLGYFESLEAATGNITVEKYDQLLYPALAKKYKVNNNGTVVLALPSGEEAEEGEDGKKKEPPVKSESFKLTNDPKRTNSRAARTELRELDSKVNTALMKLRRDRRVAYLTVGHGELNDTNSEWALNGGRIFRQRGGLKANVIKQALRNLNFQVKELGLAQGLSSEIPDDASLVLILGPTFLFSDAELDTLDRYLSQGGRLLIALDPSSETGLGAKLEGRLGVRFNPAPLTDDKRHAPGSGMARRFTDTERFSSHASVTTLTRAGRASIPLLISGSFDEVPFVGGGKPKRTTVIKSRSTTFADLNNDFNFNKDAEKRQQYSLVVSIEDPEARAPDAAEDDKDAGMRAMVFSDVEVFSDFAQNRSLPLAVLFNDAVKWLGGEEHIAGAIVSEKDVYIEHTQNEDKVWFYSTIMGAPLLILGFGLWFGRRRRQRMQRRAS